MSESVYPQFTSSQEMQEQLVEHFGVSEDVAIVNGLHLLTAVSAALSDRPATVGQVPSKNMVIETHRSLAVSGTLPQHLRSRNIFIRRYAELVGSTLNEVPTSEITTTVKDRLTLLAPDTRQSFEGSMGATQSEFIRTVLHENPSEFGNIALASTTHISDGEVLRGKFLERLPKSHAGFAVVAPTVNDMVARCNEAQSGTIANVAFVNKGTYDSEVAQGLIKGFGIPDKRSFTSGKGLATGIGQLQERQQSDRSLKRGFGVILAEGIGHHPLQEIMTVIDAAPSLLAARGMLLLSESSALDNGQGTVFDLIHRGRKAFGHDPRVILSSEGHRMAYSEGVTQLEADGIGGRSVVFMKQ